MNWEKLKPLHYKKHPVEHLYTGSIFRTDEYERLYENQNNLEHSAWKQFDEHYKTGYQFYRNLEDINFEKEVIALWFFKDRNDRSAGSRDIVMNGTNILYAPNHFLLTKSKDFQIIQREKRQWINRPVIQLDLKESTYEKICERFR